MRKSKKRRPRRPARTGVYRGFRWERDGGSILGVPIFTVYDQTGKNIGGGTDYKGFIERYQARYGVPPDIERKKRERGMARALTEFFANA